MDTVGKIIESIQNLYSKGVASDDTALSSRLIYAKMVRVRNFLLAGQAKKKAKDRGYKLFFTTCSRNGRSKQFRIILCSF